MTKLPDDSRWWLHWRVEGDECGCSLVPMRPAELAEPMERMVAIAGADNVWIEPADGKGVADVGTHKE